MRWNSKKALCYRLPRGWTLRISQSSGAWRFPPNPWLATDGCICIEGGSAPTGTRNEVCGLRSTRYCGHELISVPIHCRKHGVRVKCSVPWTRTRTNPCSPRLAIKEGRGVANSCSIKQDSSRVGKLALSLLSSRHNTQTGQAASRGTNKQVPTRPSRIFCFW